MGLVAAAGKVNHAVEAGEGCAVALVAMAVELLLGEDISTVLEGRGQYGRHPGAGRVCGAMHAMWTGEGSVEGSGAREGKD